MTATLTVAPEAQAKRWPKYPYCRTWTCVTHTRELRKERKARCLRNSWKVGASVYGGPHDRSSGAIGYRGDDLYSHPDSYAELGMGTALGGLRYRQRLDVIYHGRVARAYKRDIGFGGGPVGGFRRAIDLWHQLAAKLKVGFGLVVVRVSRNRCF